jgi:transcriptional regulator with XRE-family HTH domain
MAARRRDDFVVDPGPLGARIRRIRTDHGLTRDAVPGVSRSSLDVIEAGRGHPSLDTLIRLADCFGVTLDDLVGRTIAPARAPHAAGELPPGSPGGDLEQSSAVSPNAATAPTAATRTSLGDSSAVGLLDPANH